MFRSRHGIRMLTLLGTVAVLLGLTVPGAAATTTIAAAVTVSPMANISSACPGGNSEVEEATAPPHYIYAEWMGCNGGIGFARSADDGRTWSKGFSLLGSTYPAVYGSWDPALAVAPDGTIYASYMVANGGPGNSILMYPQVAVSTDHGASFANFYKDLPPVTTSNWGDRDFIAVGRNGTLYLTWNYGPSSAVVTTQCAPGGSCGYATGDLNAVIQTSTDGGKTWSPVTSMAPGFPANGGTWAPLVVQPDGRVDAVDLSHQVDPGTYKLNTGYEEFLSSRDGTTWPANPQPLFADDGPVALQEWWIDGDISTDSGGNLYITWDTQTSAGDIGWLTWSSDGGRHWATPVRITPDTDNAMHLTEVAGASDGTAYVAWQTDAPAQGYATYVRPFSIRRGWLAPAVQVSGSSYGNASLWPGDTFGISPLPGGRVSLTWGSAVGSSPTSDIYSSVVTFRNNS
jgi:hypothetical protein